MNPKSAYQKARFQTIELVRALASPLQGERGRGGNWASGTYTYLLSSKGEKLKSGKIEVIH